MKNSQTQWNPLVNAKIAGTLVDACCPFTYHIIRFDLSTCVFIIKYQLIIGMHVLYIHYIKHVLLAEIGWAGLDQIYLLISRIYCQPIYSTSKQWEKDIHVLNTHDTVDGRNPAPPWIMKTL